MLEPASGTSARASPLPGVPREGWERLARALEVQGVGEVDESGGLGAYALRPRRLVELGLATGLRTERSPGGRQRHRCRLLPPLDRQLLMDPVLQRSALAMSLRLHLRDLAAGRLRRPEGLDIPAALAVLHRGGRGALEGWPEAFDDTKALARRARGAFR